MTVVSPSSFWIYIFLIAVTVAILSMEEAVVYPFFPTEAVKHGVSATSVGFILAAYTLVMFFGSISSGLFMSETGTHTIMTVGILLSSLATIFFGVLNKLPSRFLYVFLSVTLRLLEGVGSSLYTIAGFCVASQLGKNNVATVYAVLENAYSIGGMLGLSLGGALYEYGGFPLPFLTVGALCLSFGLSSNVAIRIATSSSSSKTTKGQEELPPFPGKEKGLRNHPWVRFFRASSSVRIIISSLFAAAVLVQFPALTLSIHLHSLGNDQPAAVALLFSLGSLIEIVVTVIVGRIVDSLSYSRQSFLIMRLGAFLLCGAFILMGPSPLIQPLFGSHVLSPVTATVAAYVVSMIGSPLLVTPVPHALFSAAHKVGFGDDLDTSAMIASIYNATWELGNCIGSLLAGVLMDSLGFEWGASCMALISFGIFILFGFSHGPRHLPFAA